MWKCLRIGIMSVVAAAGVTMASGQTFRGFVQGGATLSQIDGDNLAGYNRFGGTGGAGVWYDLADRWRTSLTIAFAQNGSKASAREAQLSSTNPLSDVSKVSLNYVTVPVSLHYMDWLSDDAVFYRLEFLAGLEYRRLVTTETINPAGQNIDQFFTYRNNGVGLQLGAWFSTSERMAFGLQHSWGLLSARPRNEPIYFSKQVYLLVRRAF